MKKLYLFCGMPFSGKTTLATSLCEYLNCPYVSLDDINTQRGLNGGDGILVEEWEQTHSIAVDILQKLMLSQQDILLDDTSCFHWLRERYRTLGCQYNYQTVIIYLDIPLQEINSRIKNNEITKTRLSVKQDIIDEMSKTFEPPQIDENVIVYTLNEDFQQWVTNYFGD